MLDSNPNKIISETAKTNSKLAESCSDDKTSRAFWYWLGYWNGQDSITNPDKIRSPNHSNVIGDKT